MGALSGSMTVAAYDVRGELPKDFRDRYVEAIAERRFREIDLHTDADESLGWVTITDPFNVDFNLNQLLWGDYLMLSLRHDVIRLPAAAFKLHFRRALAEYLTETGKERATKAEEDEVKDHLTKQLRKRVLPAIRTYEFVWNIQRMEAWLFTANKRVNEIFLDFFGDTFTLPLIPKTPYSQLERLGLDQDVLDRVVQLEPTSFAVPPAAS